MLKAGIVGLPNAGKSTLFNAVSRTHKAAVANYPFCTIEPNVGVVYVPDERLGRLEQLFKTGTKIPTAIEFIDIAGLVKGANKGEGLGNQFLANIREVDAIVQVVRCFEDPDIIHTMGGIDPVRLLADQRHRMPQRLGRPELQVVDQAGDNSQHDRQHVGGHLREIDDPHPRLGRPEIEQLPGQHGKSLVRLQRLRRMSLMSMCL